MTENKNDNILSLVEIFLILIKEMAKILDKLKKEEIDPAKVDVKKWIETLENLQDLPEK